MLKKSFVTIAVASLVLLPMLAFAQPAATPGLTTPTNLGTVKGVIDLIYSLAGWFQTIIFAIAFIMLLYAAFLFITAAGSEEKIGSARQALIWGLIGVAVALFAKVAITFVENALTGR